MIRWISEHERKVVFMSHVGVFVHTQWGVSTRAVGPESTVRLEIGAHRGDRLDEEKAIVE